MGRTVAILAGGVVDNWPLADTCTFSPDSAWWTFRGLQEVVREDYPQRGRIVRAAWSDFEREMRADQRHFEDEAIRLWDNDRRLQQRTASPLTNREDSS